MPSGKLTRRFLLSTLWPALVFALASGPPGSPAASQPRRLSESSGNTTISFFNVGACAAVAAVKIEFRNVGGLNGICPRTYRASGGRCHIPGPYGREVYISLWGTVSYLDITLLNPAEDDVNLTTPERVYISPDQRRNFVGIYVRPGSTPLTCGSGFTVLSDGFDAGDVAPGYFRSVFRNAALDVGSADVISNQDSTITTLQEAQSFAIDQLLVTTQDMPNPVGISFATENAGTAVYVPGGNLPAGAGLTEPQLQEFFNTTMRTRGMVAAGADDPILSSWIAPEQNYAFVEFATVESANQALSLNGLTLGQNSLRISRPNNYQPTVGVNELIDPAALQGGVLAQTGNAVLPAAVGNAFGVGPVLAAPPAEPVRPHHNAYPTGLPSAAGAAAGAAGEAAVDHRTAGACTSACLALANMLSADEMEEIVGSAAEHAGIKEDTTEECEKFGPVAACKVPFAANDERLIYVRWETIDGAAKAMAGLHGRKFAGRTVAVSCVPPEQFDAVVDGAAA